MNDMKTSEELIPHHINCYILKSRKRDKSEENSVEVFYCRTRELDSLLEELKKYLSGQEKMRADKFLFDSNRKTYICSHALLRLILSARLHIDPEEIIIVNDSRMKPCLFEGALHFNLTHTREAFAIAVSRKMYVGIDIEDINRQTDITSLIRTCLSEKENEFVTKNKQKERERFFLLWTRKEAFLKAIGIGISTNLSRFETSERKNVFLNDTMGKSGDLSKIHYIFSQRLHNCYMSVAIPERTPIVVNHLNISNIRSYIPDSRLQTK